MRIDPENPKHLIADDGKVLRRIVDLIIFGKELILGYNKYDGVYRMETVDDFEEIDEPEDEGEIIPDEV